jgi:hypothetical protein
MQIKYANAANKPPPRRAPADNNPNRVRTLTGKEIELDIESDYKVRHDQFTHPSEARRHDDMATVTTRITAPRLQDLALPNQPD